MGANTITYFEKYTPVGDIAAYAVCSILLILIFNSFINRTRGFFILRHIIYTLMLSSVSDMLFHIAMNHTDALPHMVMYVLRLIFHISLFVALCLYILYATEALELESHVKKPFLITMSVLFAVALIVEITGTAFGFSFRIYEDRVVEKDLPIFLGIYVLFLVTLSLMMVRYRHRIFKQVFVAVSASTFLAVLIMILQQLNEESSFTVISFVLPIFALLYMLHANPYDINIGSVGEKAFDDLIASNVNTKTRKKDVRQLYFMSLYMHELEGLGSKYPREMQDTIRNFVGTFFKSPTLFQISSGHMILVADKKKDPDYKEHSMKMLQAFKKAYSKMQYDYKIVYLDSDERLDADNEYLSFINYLHGTMPENSIHFADVGNVDAYIKRRYIINQLADIAEKADPDDPRVVVYCQPVYNIHSNSYDTAEALMRLKLPDTGMVFPDEFIPIAEENKYIQTLTKIILAKTCAQIKRLDEEGYYVKRISVNFSIYDVREDDFCITVRKIIEESGINSNQIAFEITESQNEQDFEVIKERFNELKDSGIKFYLDDFGTGYSNFERIMELPFDIVKFDRSLVIASGHDEKYKAMVSHLAEMFNEVNYAVLYEGIEDEMDESRCIGMSAKYLQGYKYSRPIPIEQLTVFFSKKNEKTAAERAINEDKGENDGMNNDKNAVYKCPVCGETVFNENGKYEICPVCGWEDDPVQKKDPDFAGGANRLSLNESIKAWRLKA